MKERKKEKKQDRTCQNEKTLTYPYGFTVYPWCFMDTMVLQIQVSWVQVRVGPCQPVPDPCATLHRTEALALGIEWIGQLWSKKGFGVERALELVMTGGSSCTLAEDCH